MKRIVCCLFALLLAGGARATSYYHSEDALENLRLAYERNDPEARAAYFRGYVVGVADSTHGSAWCPPGNVPAERIHGIVSAYMKNHPPTAELGAAAVVTAALGASFPCANK
jgi:hypothetical protein